MRENWYDSALFFLQRSDVLRAVDLQTLQAIGVLNVCFVIFGDFDLYCNLWMLGVRIGYSCGLHRDSMPEDGVPGALSIYQRRQLWWTLVISDWLNFNIGHTCIRASDVRATPPEWMLDPDIASSDEPHPLQHHIAFSKVACALYSFDNSLRFLGQDTDGLDAIIRNADNDLAEVIAWLPPHLQLDEEQDEAQQERDAMFPWIPWQKKGISIILLYYRMVVHRVHLNATETSRDSARGSLICLDSAHAILDAVLNEPVIRARPNIWYD